MAQRPSIPVLRLLSAVVGVIVLTGSGPDDTAETADTGAHLVDCDEAAAFWTVTAVGDDSGASASGSELTDDRPLFDLCGEEIGAYIPGELHTDWGMVADETDGEIDVLFCVKAIDRPDADGATPVVPTVDECLDSSDVEWRTRPCDAPAADAVVTDAFDMGVGVWDEEVTEAVNDCAGEAYRVLVDQFDRLSGVIRFDFL